MARSSKWNVAGAVLMTTVVLLSGPAVLSGQALKLPEGVTAKMVEEGQKIFAGSGTCLTCHGEKGLGTPVAPNLSDDKWLNIDGTFDAIVKLVNTGVPQPKEHMVPMLPRAGIELTDEQVRAVAAYVWTLCRGGPAGGGRASEACSPGGRVP